MDTGSRSQSEGFHQKLLALAVTVNLALKLCMCSSSLSHIGLFGTLWTVARQAPLFVIF